MPDEAPVMKTALPAKRWRRPPNGALWILENDGLFKQEQDCEESHAGILT
jgi:hypothetical protein